MTLHSYMACWTVLSRLLLRPPTEGDLQAVRDPGLLAVWPLGREGFAKGLDFLAASAHDGEGVGEVRSDYLALFVGPGHLLAPPYESVQRGEERLVFDAETLQVRAWYSRFGLEAPRLNQEPDDHVGLELEFLTHLGRLALDQPEEEARVFALLGQFVAEHLGTWAPALASQIQAHAATCFYRGVGHLLGATVARTMEAFPAQAEPR